LLKPAIKIVLISSGFHATLNYRISHSLRYRFGIVGRLLAVSCFWWGRHIYGCSISPVARLHGGLIMPHPQGIVIGAGAVLGPRGWIFQNVTIGGAPEKVGLPQVGADSRIFAGAVLVGPIVIGDNVVVGANAVVYRDVPARSIARSPGFEVYPLPDRLIVGVSDQDSVV
jgi:serine O-acetyltransferase